MRRTKAEEELSELFIPSPELGLVVGQAALTKLDAVMRIWAYVKANDLYDQESKRLIRADALLLPLFESPSVTVFQLPKILERHLRKNLE